jgi:hypothetical protein
MSHHPEQNILAEIFVLLVCPEIVGAEDTSCKKEALALECGHSSSIAQGFAAGQSQPGRCRCGAQIANEIG